MNFWNWIGLPSAADIQELKEISLGQAEALTALNKNVSQLLENTQSIKEKSDELSEATQTYYDNAVQLILKQSEALSASLKQLKAILQNLQRMDMGTQRRLEQVLSECRSQNELLRILVANSLIDDLSQTIGEDEH